MAPKKPAAKLPKPVKALAPKRIDAYTWFYEEPKGLAVVHEVRRSDGSHIRTDIFTVPRRMVIAAADRYRPILPKQRKAK